MERKKRRFPPRPQPEVCLLVVFVASAFIISTSIIIAPWTLESQTDYLLAPAQYQHHGVTSQLKNTHSEVEQLLKKTTGDSESSPKDHQNPNVVSYVQEMVKKQHETEEFFLTHSTQYHTIFSTGCSIFQDWQSYVFFYHVLRSGQEGHITRIASGCDKSDETKLKEMFEKEILSMKSDTHHLHLTPDYSRVPKKAQRPYKYFNKPYGVRHWMSHALGYPKNHKLHDDSIIILMDPDQIMLRPFTNDFTNSSEKWRSPRTRKLKVEHGSPFAQQYGFSMQWKHQVKPENIFKGSEFPSPVLNMSSKEGLKYYFAMGPPYIATAKDMWKIVNTWADIAPLVHDDYPHLLAEMFAYNLAVAHLGIRHTIAQSFQVSDPWAGGEGFPLIDKVPESNICKNFPQSELPHVIHYCQKYYLGKWYIGKYKLRKDFISCEAPLLMYPPENLASKYTTSILPGHEEIKEIRPKQVKEQAFMICNMIDALNAASKYYKDKHCKDVRGNYNYSYVFHDDMLMPDEK